jgi:hypothetical protein
MEEPIKFIELLEYGEWAGVMGIGIADFKEWAGKRGIATEGPHTFHWDFLKSWIEEAFCLINPEAHIKGQAYVIKGEYHSHLIAHRSLQEARESSEEARKTSREAIKEARDANRHARNAFCVTIVALGISIAIGYKQIHTPVKIKPGQLASIQTTQAAYEHQEAMAVQTLNDISNAVDKSLLASQAAYDKQADKTTQALNDIAQILRELKDSRQASADGTDGASKPQETTQDPKQVEHTPSPEKTAKDGASQS